MKKIAFLFLAVASLALANNTAYKKNVGKFVSDKTQRDIEVKEVFDLKGSKDVKVLILYDKKDKAEIAVLATKDGNIVLGLSNVFLSKSNGDLEILAKAYHATQPKVEQPKPEELNKFFSSLPDARFISFASSAKKPKQTFYMVSDPRCPGCFKELQSIEEKLKEGDVKILLVSFLGEESAYKAQLIYTKTANLKDNAQKLKIMREIYDPKYQLSPKDKTLDIKPIEQNNTDVSKAGIQSVPFVHAIKR